MSNKSEKEHSGAIVTAAGTCAAAGALVAGPIGAAAGAVIGGLGAFFFAKDNKE